MPTLSDGREWNANSREERKMGRMTLAGELWAFMRVRKKWWLLPIVLVMLVVGTLMVFAHGSVLAPFIYTIF